MFGAIAGGIASALAGGAMSKLFGGGQKAASGGIQGDVLATDNNTVGMGDRSEERRVGKECRSGWWLDHLKKKVSDGLICGWSGIIVEIVLAFCVMSVWI